MFYARVMSGLAVAQGFLLLTVNSIGRILRNPSRPGRRSTEADVEGSYIRKSLFFLCRIEFYLVRSRRVGVGGKGDREGGRLLRMLLCHYAAMLYRIAVLWFCIFSFP